MHVYIRYLLGKDECKLDLAGKVCCDQFHMGSKGLIRLENANPFCMSRFYGAFT